MEATLFLEIRERMQSGSLIIRELHPESWPVDIAVMPSLVELKSGKACKAFSLPPGVAIVPSSCRGLQYLPGEGLHLRLLVQVDFSAKLMPAVGDGLKSKKSCTFYCQSCGESVINNRTFLRVLSLPFENWNDLVEEWCCHPNPFNDSLLHPQNDDCFLGHNYLMINSRSELSGTESGILYSEDEWATSCESPSNSQANSTVICKRCKTLLGEAMPSGVIKYYFTELLVQPSEDSFHVIPRSSFIRSVIARCFMELAFSRSTFRFSIQGMDGTVYILIWILNCDTLMVETSGNPASNNVFTLLEPELSSSLRPAEIHKAVKVLYHPCTENRNKDLVDSWGEDIGVSSLTFPSKTCLELLLILSQSNASLPPSLRWMNSFQGGQIGYEHKSYNREEMECILMSGGPLLGRRDSAAKIPGRFFFNMYQPVSFNRSSLKFGRRPSG
ncbi:E3 ubiquitin-protein ligase E3D isoform X1 [Python bivittatus]|uniref:E3 ubiquitin-protein ligase E3D n=1 Tax=Python bivittatus TaxID=176946 RepID=A0A9F5IHN7_PYTBI|nr:E3 ubiquitin-protein ligase E3D isoform X1 [Python bivittatus]XP_025020686.1 E3 ubiquitin-protein ligase E3D isoform X1 [Python bivittatus]XP_025020687.1 E3 ubiquitin-protein ligase E3D isoform X1 [Python bivittatus]XP_025020688.1 E3 ubiquitin-protein ligase E3D isoform X1 [Python bivittatus]